MKNRFFLLMIFIFFKVRIFNTFALSANASKMTKGELKGLLGNPDLIIVDLRLGRDWTGVVRQCSICS
jgi:hypothetical protein